MKKIISILSIIFVLFLSVTPNYIVYASGEQTESLEVTSNDSIVQKILNYGLSNWGALNRLANSDYITGIDTAAKNRMLETIASLMNGGGIYVDDNGDYVFTNVASQQLYNSMMNNSTTDAKVISDFSNFTYLADGYVNSKYLLDCNTVTAWGKDISDGSTGNYLLDSLRYISSSGNIITILYCFKLPSNFGFISLRDLGNNNSGAFFYNNSSSNIQLEYRYSLCSYSPSRGSYSNETSSIRMRGSLLCFTDLSEFNTNYYSINDFYNSFPNFYNVNYNNNDCSFTFYCNNSLLFSKNVVGGNGLYNQTSGIFSSYKNIGTINKNVLEQNDWTNIYNNYVSQVNIDYQQDPTMSAVDLRKIMKKYTGTIIDAINNGTSNIEDTISISNRYLQAISVDVRNISDKLDNLQSGGGSSDGWTSSQVSQALNLINSIDTNVLDIAGSCDALADDVGDLNTELVTMNTALNNIYQRLLNMNGGGGGSPTVTMPTDWNEVLQMLTDVSDGKADQIATVLEVVGDVLKMSVPFCYISVIGGAITALSADPIPPVFDVEVKSEQGNSLDFAVQEQIDLTWIADLRPVWIAMEEILFVIGLIMFTFTIYTTFGSLFS